jgi:hypothetical protein
MLALLQKSLSDHFSKSHVVENAIEKRRQWGFKRARKNQEFFLKETPKLLYSVVINNRPPKIEPENKPEQEVELGLPPQPAAYLKYPGCDWL